MKNIIFTLAAHLRLLSQIPSWYIQNFVSLITEGALSFLAVYLMLNGYTTIQALMIFAGVYFSATLLIAISRLLGPRGDGWVPKFVALTASGLGCLAWLEDPGLVIAGMAAAGLVVRDMVMTNVVGKVHAQAARHGIAPSSIVASSMIFGAIIMIGGLWGSGLVMSSSEHLWIALAGAGFAIVAASLFSARMAFKKMTQPVAISQRVFFICGLSGCYNAVSFVGRRFLLPVTVAGVAIKMGMPEQAYANVGLFVGLIALFGLATRSMGKSTRSAQWQMYMGFGVGLVLWLVIAGILAFDAQGLLALSAALVCLLVIEFTAKIWTIGFIETLRAEAARDSDDEADAETRQIAYFNFFMQLKNAGATIGFSLAVIALSWDLPVVVPGAALALMFGLISYLKISKISLAPTIA